MTSHGYVLIISYGRAIVKPFPYFFANHLQIVSYYNVDGNSIVT